MSNSEYPVGTVCVIVGPNIAANYLLGRECVIVRGLHYDAFEEGDRYEIEIERELVIWTAAHEYLKPKYPPQKDKDTEQEVFKNFMDKLLKPVSVPEEDLV